MRHYEGHFLINWHHNLSFWKKSNLPYSNHLVPLIVFSMSEANIVVNEIRLLMSRSPMKKAQMIIKFDDDMAQILGNQFKLNCTSTSHYCIPLTKLLVSDKDSRQSPVVLHTMAVRNGKNLSIKQSNCIVSFLMHPKRNFANCSNKVLVLTMTSFWT